MKNLTKKPWVFRWIWRIMLINILVLGSCDIVEDALPDDDPNLPNVTALNGEWLRVDGNNTGANGMTVEVSNGKSTILDPSATFFSVGALKWKDIQPTDKDLFTHLELGSDGNYYDATIKVINDDEIEINVVSGGSGNEQKWIRVSGAGANDFVKLQGLWKNIDKTASINLLVDVKGSAGTVIGGNGTIKDIVWKDIELAGTNTFTLQIRGADGKYYSATIKIISEDKLEIVIGSGETQTYERFSGSQDLSKIQGNWTRVESNNPGSDYMQVNVDNDQATLVDKAQSGFSEGDIKWKDITSTTAGKFTHQELGSDYNYYGATIEMVNDSTLEIVVVASGAGNAQKWVRNPTAKTIELDCNITTATTLVNGPAEVDYRVSCVLDVTAALTIEPGVVIEFENEAGLGIYDNGSVNAEGTADKPIVFKGLSGTKGSWRGIHTETNSVDNRFEYVTIQDAGSNYVYCCNIAASLYIKSGQFAIENSTIENGAGIGLYVHNNAELNNFSNVRITTHDEYPVSASLERVGEMDGLSSDFSGNDQDYVQILGTAVGNEITIQAANIPYMIDDVINLTGGVTISEGAEFVMREKAGLGVYDNGYLKIQGTSNDPVIMRGYEPVPGYWRGIHIETASINNDIDYAEISDAGSDYVYCCNDAATIYYKAGKASISNTTISNGKSYGIYAGKTFEFDTFLNNTVTTHDEYPMYIAVERIGELDGMGSDYSGNTQDYIAIFNSDVDKAISWSKTNVPYFIDEGVIDILDKVEFEKGAEIVFAENAGLGVYNNGIFNAVGTSGENITFRGKNDVVGFWRGIHIETNSQDNVLDYCRVSNAGSNYVYCCNVKTAILAQKGLLSVTNCQIEKSGGCGLAIKQAATVTESGNTFSNNTDGSICE